ncbi:hypothetical protein FRB98_000698, partial [Tulasnella sp. 332]
MKALLYMIYGSPINNACCTREKKKRIIVLHNPIVEVIVMFSGKINFRWQFMWEDHTSEFKRDELFRLRRTDPPVLVTVFDFKRKRDKMDIEL